MDYSAAKNQLRKLIARAIRKRQWRKVKRLETTLRVCEQNESDYGWYDRM